MQYTPKIENGRPEDKGYTVTSGYLACAECRKNNNRKRGKVGDDDIMARAIPTLLNKTKK
jgi:hypothetical protein